MNQTSFSHAHYAKDDELTRLTLGELLDIVDQSGGQLAVCGTEGGRGPGLIIAAVGAAAEDLSRYLQSRGVVPPPETKGVQA